MYYNWFPAILFLHLFLHLWRCMRCLVLTVVGFGNQTDLNIVLDRFVVFHAKCDVVDVFL